jgi:hypothetical protein
LLATAACLEERPRPGPPRVTFTLDRISVRSNNPPVAPDTLSGTLQVGDSDGLDSVWVTVDSAQAGEDAGFEQRFSSRFHFPIRPGRAPTTRIPVEIRARDVVGFVAQRDTYVVVVP